MLVRVLGLDLDAFSGSKDLNGENETAWDEEVAKRVAEIESGEVQFLSRAEFDSAFSEARQKLAARRQASA